jgi:hypothetical protein
MPKRMEKFMHPRPFSNGIHRVSPAFGLVGAAVLSFWVKLSLDLALALSMLHPREQTFGRARLLGPSRARTK